MFLQGRTNVPRSQRVNIRRRPHYGPLLIAMDFPYTGGPTSAVRLWWEERGFVVELPPWSKLALLAAQSLSVEPGDAKVADQSTNLCEGSSHRTVLLAIYRSNLEDRYAVGLSERYRAKDWLFSDAATSAVVATATVVLELPGSECNMFTLELPSRSCGPYGRYRIWAHSPRRGWEHQLIEFFVLCLVAVLVKPLFDTSATDELALYTQLTQQFQKDTGIAITVSMGVTFSADPAAYYQTAKKYIEDHNDVYDIIALDQSWLDTWPGNKYFVNLFKDEISGTNSNMTDLFASRVLNDENEATTEADSSPDGLMAIPLWNDFSALFARSDLLTKYNISIPISYQQMVEACQKILPAEQVNRRSLQCFVSGMIGQEVVDFMGELVYNNNTTPLINFPQTPTFDTGKNAAMLNQFRSWIVDSHFMTERSMQYDYGTALNIWTLGDSVFYRGKFSSLHQTYTQWQGKGWVPAVIPGNSPNAETQMYSTPGGYHLAMTKHGENKNDSAVAEALLFLTGPVVQKERALRFGAPPSLKSLSADPVTCQATNCTITPFLIDKTSSPNAAPLWVEASAAMAPWFTKIFDGTVDPKTGLASAKIAVLDVFSGADSGLSTKAVILLAVLIPIAAVALLVGGFLLYRKRRIRNSERERKIEDFEIAANAGSGTPEMSQTTTSDATRMNFSTRPARSARDPAKPADLNQRVMDAKTAGATAAAAGAGIVAISTSPSDAENHTSDLPNRGRDGEIMTGDESSGHVRGRGGNRTSSSDMVQRFTVIHPYKPKLADEIELKPGDVVSVRLAYDDGYAFGQNDRAYAAGVFPLACLLPVGMELGLPSRLESGASNVQAMQHAPEKVDSLEMLLLSGKITEGTYLALRREQEDEMRTQRQIAALRERLAAPNLEEAERKKLQKRLDEIELGIDDDD
ncbi:uncharacterized protein EV422DRAFT_614365 [Fimicolochytrium jonesii]|uniref:uncharacterized protein n=1 Tax=Fimicolochytrium jonesii TaxID=1396493 RepID=UPI0022FDCAE7|nr:uncharacterized protein EV422DRAFT_614365 [Fimicolochytrium jonesii]KAI8822041.1 hypothetical protein EV422DRAFT_614365 [Fimicolochytrium jonesii]